MNPKNLANSKTMTREDLESVIEEVIVPSGAGRPPKKEAEVIRYLFERQYKDNDLQTEYVPKGAIIEHLRGKKLAKRRLVVDDKGRRKREPKWIYLSREWRRLTSTVNDANRKLFKTRYRNMLRIRLYHNKGLSLLVGWKDVVQQLRKKGLRPLSGDYERIREIIKECEESFRIRGAPPDMNSLILAYQYRDSVLLSKDELKVLIIGAIRQSFPASYWLRRLDTAELKHFLMQQLETVIKTGSVSIDWELRHTGLNLTRYCVNFIDSITHNSPTGLAQFRFSREFIEEDPVRFASFLSKSQLKPEQIKQLLVNDIKLSTYERAIGHYYFSYLLSDKDLVDKIQAFNWEDFECDAVPFALSIVNSLVRHQSVCFISLSRELRKRKHLDLYDFYLSMLRIYYERYIKTKDVQDVESCWWHALEITKYLTEMTLSHPCPERESTYVQLLLEFIKSSENDIPIKISIKKRSSLYSKENVKAVKELAKRASTVTRIQERELGTLDVVLISLISIWLRNPIFQKEVISWLEEPEFDKGWMIIWALKLNTIPWLVERVIHLAEQKVLRNSDVLTFCNNSGVKGDRQMINLVLHSIPEGKTNLQDFFSCVKSYPEVLSNLGYKIDQWPDKSLAHPDILSGAALRFLEFLGGPKTIRLCLDHLEKAISSRNYSAQKECLKVLQCMDERIYHF